MGIPCHGVYVVPGRMSVKRCVLAVLCAIAVLLAPVVRFLFSTSSNVVTTSYTVKLGSSGKRVRVVHLSDLHFTASTKEVEDLVKAIVSLEPDIVVMTGDYVSNPKGIGVLEKLVCGIMETDASIPVFAVLGNWEFEQGFVEDVREVMERCGAILLVNNYGIVEVNDVRIVVVGFDDYLWGNPNLDIIEHVPPHDLAIALVHEPVLGPKLAEKGFKGIVFTGHCHGGQVKILGKPVLLPPGCSANLYEGVHKVNNTVIVISRGIGTSILPIRIGAPPEIIVTTIEL